MSAADPPAGFPATDRYTYLSVLGSGGMGVVYAAHDRTHGESVALKTLRRLEPAALSLFKNEFRSLASLRHPNLVRLRELVGADGQWFLTMDLIEGRDLLGHVSLVTEAHAKSSSTLHFAETASLSEIHALTGKHPASDDPDATLSAPDTSLPAPPAGSLDRLCAVFEGVLDGLAALHSHGKLHRDLKPSNIQVRPDGTPVLLDFGLVVDLARDSSARSAAGTLRFMAPEQLRRDLLSPATDLYAVGVMLFELLAHRSPHGEEPALILAGRVNGPPPPISAFVADLDPELAALVDGLLRDDPASRPSLEQARDVLTACRARIGIGRPQTEPPSSLASMPPGVSTGPGAPVPGPGGAPMLVGRKQELDVLRSAVEEVRAGGPQAVVVRGSSGLGKSALIEHFCADERSRGARVFAGRCYEQETVPFKAIDPVVDRLVAHLLGRDRATLRRLLPRDAASIARVFPVFDQVPGVSRPGAPPQLPPEPRELRRRAIAALRELLARLTAEAPVIVVIDDLQWGDSDS